MGKFWRDFSVGKITHLDFAHGKISCLEIFPWEIFVGIFPWGKLLMGKVSWTWCRWDQIKFFFKERLPQNKLITRLRQKFQIFVNFMPCQIQICAGFFHIMISFRNMSGTHFIKKKMYFLPLGLIGFRLHFFRHIFLLTFSDFVHVTNRDRGKGNLVDGCNSGIKRYQHRTSLPFIDNLGGKMVRDGFTRD